jgi:glycosyltransferase involved in cell wall biosynthesis
VSNRDVIHVLLPTFDGARFLAGQIDSLQAQSHAEWRLLVRDDGSRDGSLALVERYSRSDSRIVCLTDTAGHLGCAGSFARLMDAARREDARVIAFADQDDVWLPDKLARTLARLRAVERLRGASHPVLVHSDLLVVAEDGRPRHPSFLRYERIGHDPAQPLRTLLLQNFVTGCTALFNAPLLERALPLPPETPMHDWWVALCAAAFGTIAFEPAATVRYRQHAHTTLGRKGFVNRLLPWRADWGALWRRGNRAHQQAWLQARSLQARLHADPQADRQRVALLDAGLAAFDADVSGLVRIGRARRAGLRSQHPLRTLLFYTRLMLGTHTRPASIRGL